MPTSRHTFARLDTDTAASAKPASSFDAALNIALEPGYVTAVAGNVAVGYDLPPTGTNRRLGGFADGSTGAVVSLLYNSSGRHRLVRYDPLGNGGAGSETTLLEWGGLNLSPDLVPQGGIVDGLLTYLGADGLLRSVNLERVAAGFYTPALLAAEPFCLHEVKPPPTVNAPTAVRRVGTGGDPRENLRIIQPKAYQFACRWHFLDGEVSVLSPFSPWLDVLEDPATTTYNYITVTLPPAPAGVSSVEVLTRNPDTDGWLGCEELTRTASGLPASYNFYGVLNGTALTAAEAIRLHEAEWPGRVAGIAHSRAFKADLLEGYVTPEPAFTATVTTGNSGTVATDTYKLVVEYFEPGPPSQNGEPVPDIISSQTNYFLLASGTYPEPTSQYNPIVTRNDGGQTRYTARRDVTLSYADAFAVGPRETYREVTIERLALSDGTNDLTTFHENSSYRVAVQFYDAQGKAGGVSKAVSVFVPKREKGDQNYRSILASLTTTDLAALNAEIPAWAYSYQFMVARNDRTLYFLQGQAADCFGYLGHTIEVKSDGTRVESEKLVDIIHNAHQKVWVDIGNFPAAGQGYVWQPGSGDVLRFLNEDKEFIITNQVGDYLEVQWDGYPNLSVDATGQTVARIEIYSPNTTQSALFYERGPRLAIQRTGAGESEQRSYSQPQVLLEGDCFLVSLRFPQLDKGRDKDNDENYQPPNRKSWLSGTSDWVVLVESMVPPFRLAPATTTTSTIYEKREKGGFFSNLVSNPLNLIVPVLGVISSIDYLTTDEPKTPANSAATTVNAGRTAANFTWLDMSFGGRAGAQVPAALQQVRREKTIRFSGVKVAGTLLNGLSQWEALSQYDELPQEQGAVTSLTVADQTQTDGSILLATQQRGSVSLSLGRQQVQTADGQALLSISKQVIGSSNALRGGYGCTDQGSVVAYAGKVFYYCRERHELVRYDRNGNSPLGLTYKARTRLAELAARYAGAVVRGCFHPYIDRKEYWLTFEPVGELPGTTLVYSDLYEAFADELSYAPEAGLAAGAELLTWQAGTLYRHTPDAPAATFCGAYTPPTLTFTVAQPAGVAKQFKDVGVESRSLWLPTATATDTQLSSLMRSGWFTYREGIWRGGQRRATNTPGFATPFHALDRGNPLVGAAQTITLTAPEGAAGLVACQVSWLPRSGQAMGA
jgi:hypothetical protein